MAKWRLWSSQCEDCGTWVWQNFCFHYTNITSQEVFMVSKHLQYTVHCNIYFFLCWNLSPKLTKTSFYVELFSYLKLQNVSLGSLSTNHSLIQASVKIKSSTVGTEWNAKVYSNVSDVKWAELGFTVNVNFSSSFHCFYFWTFCLCCFYMANLMRSSLLCLLGWSLLYFMYVFIYLFGLFLFMS